MPALNHDVREPFVLERVYLFGRTYDEYEQMFNLDIEQLRTRKVLDCGAGPASFAAESNRRGLRHVIRFTPGRLMSKTWLAAT